MQLAFQHQESTIDFEYTLSPRRKTIAIIVEPPGRIRVIAPTRTSARAILEVVGARASWIIKKLDEVKQKDSTSMAREFVDGESLMYCGVEYTLEVIADQSCPRSEVRLGFKAITVQAPHHDRQLISQTLESWYRTRAREQILARIRFFQSRIGVSPNKVSIRNQKTRWGSCSARGNLSFNWRTVMAPQPVLDYIVVHEMCHLLHHNHSVDFWASVASILPDFASSKTWLKINGHQLRL